ncbi:MAG: hypothetical protein HKN50_04710 [Gammaproteobacteria bacterium]|nr:hypothetical protein [Gammaproteobacteria bacterium]
MLNKNIVLAALGGGTFIFLYGWLVNAVLLVDFWTAQAGALLMRPAGEEIMWAIAASCYLQGLVLSMIYSKGNEHTGAAQGLRFGLLAGLFVASLYLLFYGLQPWGATATAVTMLVDGLMYVGAGWVIALISK